MLGRVRDAGSATGRMPIEALAKIIAAEDLNASNDE
jgi:hypothetical protein